jgi:hypothetical protein
LQYFEAVRMGEEVARRAQVRLAGYAGSAYAAMIVKERAGEGWAPVGEEDFYAVVRKDEGFDVVVLCDGDGYVKAMSTPLPRRVAESVSAKMERDGIRRFEGSLVLPL